MNESPIVPAQVSVVDFNMPFVSIVRLMLKWTLAAIPALFILTALGGCLCGRADGTSREEVTLRRQHVGIAAGETS